LDLRQYRSKQPANQADTAAINSNSRTLLGPQQTNWLQANLLISTARWKMLGNSVQMAPVYVIPSFLGNAAALFGLDPTSTTPTPFNVDSWDGYNESRRQILGAIAGVGTGRPPVGNCVFLTGDIHSNFSCDIPADPTTPYSPATSLSLGTEYVCASVTSDNLNEIVGAPERIPGISPDGYVSSNSAATFELLLKGVNGWIRDLNLDLHGYSVVDVTPARTQVDNWVLTSSASVAFAADPRIDPNAGCIFRSAYQTLNLTQKTIPAAGPLGPRA
ncbi:MAG: alkaline phosphatase D family protein, partial [Armatimonadetes bacterium]|nr:alkaline phosphatase D family protein [Akkermansiaceae bacterium]